MFNKLRRSSKDSGPILPPGSRPDNLATSIPTTVPQDATQATFFDLPPELRNVVYELIASTATLTLPPSNPRKQKHASPLPMCGLLLVSRQCRREFLPLLYASARVTVLIKDFDFRNLMRVISSFYNTELKSLRENRGLTIQLHTQNCAREHLALLRKWLLRRNLNLDQLPWKYDVQVLPTMHIMGMVRQLRELEYYRMKLVQFGQALGAEENLMWELQLVIEAFEHKAAVLKDEFHSRSGHDNFTYSPTLARGLSGGGLR